MTNIDLVAVLAAALTVALVVSLYALLITEWRGSL
jgi:hypothetical protein